MVAFYSAVDSVFISCSFAFACGAPMFDAHWIRGDASRAAQEFDLTL
jgi:hypothetical protein